MSEPWTVYIVELQARRGDPWRWTGDEALTSTIAWHLWDRHRRAAKITEYYAVSVRTVERI